MKMEKNLYVQIADILSAMLIIKLWEKVEAH